MKLKLIKFSSEEEWHRYTVTYTRYALLLLSISALFAICYLPTSIREMRFSGDEILFELSGFTCNPTTYRSRDLKADFCPKFYDIRIKRAIGAAGKALKQSKRGGK